MGRVDVIGVQESWDLDNSKIYLRGYQWFGNPRKGVEGKRREDVIGFGNSAFI